MAHLSSTACCGMAIIDEIGGTIDPGTIVRMVKRTHPLRAHYVFSQAIDPDDRRYDNRKNLEYGEKLAAFIRKNSLGTVVKTLGRVNPNSGNTLTVFVWTVSKRNLAKFK